MKLSAIFSIIFFLFFSTPVVKAQKSLTDSSIFIASIAVNYSYHFAGGDIGNTYGNFSSVGSDFTFKLKNNIILGTSFEYFFGDNVKNQSSYFKDIKTTKGEIINANGNYAEVFLKKQGFNIQIFTGYQFHYWSPNPNSGPFIQLGAGLMEYKTLIKNTDNNAPQILNENSKMYDRLSNGLSLSQFFGYRYMGNSNLANFYIGIELTQAWTKNRRNYNADLPASESLNHFDILTTIKLGWIIPFYKRAPKEYYYY